MHTNQGLLDSLSLKLRLLSSNLNSAKPVTSELRLDERTGIKGFNIFLQSFFVSRALEWLTQSTGKITASAEEIAPCSLQGLLYHHRGE